MFFGEGGGFPFWCDDECIFVIDALCYFVGVAVCVEVFECCECCGGEFGEFFVHFDS